MAFNITAIMNVALASGAATKISRDLNKALQNKRVTVDLSLANPDSIKRIKADIEGAITSVESFGRQAGLAAKRFGAFSLAAGSMITLVGAIKSSTAEAISFDREMVRLGQVSNDSVASIQAVGNEVTRLSVALGVSSKDLIGAAVTLKQANLSIDDTKIALEALAKAALAPNFENFANTTQGAIAVLNQFKIGAAGLEAALGSVNAVAGEYAVEASDLVEVIRKTGGAFKSAGGDLNELLALFTSVRQTTRESAETISTGLRTIFTRIQRGQTIESLKELGINLRYTSQEAAALGNIKLADQFVGPYEAVRRLSEALAGIPTTSGKYSAIVEELGGYRQISKVIPLLQEFSVSQGALNVALGGSSSLAANAAQAQNAYIIKIQKIKEEFNALIRSVTQSSGFQKIFDTFISGASAAIQLADALKFLLPLITAIAAVKLATSFGQFVKGFATGVTASPNPKIFNQNRVAEGGYIKMKNGGVVPGSGSGDKVKALLEPGELVIPKKYAGGGTVSVNEMSSLAIQRKLNDPLIKEEDYKTGKTINKNDNFKYEIVTIKVDGGKETLKGDYKQQGDSFEKEAEKQLGAIRIAKSDDRGSNSPVDLEKNGFPYEVKNVSSPVSDASIVDKLARYRFQKFGDNIFKNSSKGEETIDLGQIGLVYNTAKITGNDAFKDTETITAGQENYRRKTYATQTSEGISNVTLSTQEAKNRLATKKASGGFMIPGTGNTDSFPMDLDEGSFVVRKSSVAKLGAENLSSISRQGYAKGGKVPALLMPGEFVFSPSSAKSIGSANLERMNKHAKFAAGGRVGLAAGGNPIGEEAYTVASQTQVQVPNFQKIQEFVKGFPDLTAAQASLEAIILEEVKAFRANLSETQKLAEASRIAADVMRRYEDIDNAIKAQEAVIANRSSTATQPEIEADAAELKYLKQQRGKLSKEVGLTNVGLPTGDIQSRTKIGSGSTIEVGKGKDYDYAKNEKINISDEIRNRAREKAVKISPSGDGENIASVTKIRLAAEEESKLRKQLILAIGEQLRITTGITDQEVLSEMAVEKFTIAMQQNAKLAKDSEGKLLGLVSLEQDIVDSGKNVDQSMRGVSQELKVGSTAIGKLKLSIRSIEDTLVSAGNEFAEEMRRGGGGITGTFAALRNSRLGRIGAGVAGAGLAIGGQLIASTAGTAEDVDKGLVSGNRYAYSSGVGEGINQAATTAIALSMIPVAGPFLAVIGGATAFLIGFGSAVKKAQLELLKLQVDKQAKATNEKLAELKNFSGLEREQKGTAAFTDVRATVFDIRKTAASEGFSGAKLEEEVRAKSLEKFGSNLGAISEELSNAIANMVKPDDQRKSSDIFNEFKQTTYGQLAIESLGVASGKSATEVQKHALTLASSAITAKKLEEAQKNLVIVHEKITLRINTLSNSVNLAAESFRNISDSIGSFSDKLEGRSEFKIQQNTSRLKIGTDAELFNKEADKVFVPFGELGDSVKNQAKELNAFALELPSAFDAAKEKNRDNLGGNLANLTEQNLIEKLKPQGGKFTSTQKDLFDLFKNVLETKETDIKKGGVTGDKITKEALGQTIAEYEGLLQSNAQALNQVTQSYISGLRRISEEQKKYIQEFDKISDKSLSVNKANAAIQARAVRGNPEDFLTKEQRIAPFVERQQNITAGKMEVGGIQDPQTIFDNIKKAAEALEASDKELQASNADLASSNVDAREKARGIAEKNDNLRNVVSSLGDALRNLRDETVTLAEAESRLTKAEKDRENKLSVTENLLTMDRAGKRNLRRGKEAAEQVAGGANLEDMSLKQRKAFFEYTKLYGNIKLPELGGKTGEQVRQVALERASGGQGVPVGEENKKIDEALKDIKEITIKQKEAAELYARLIKTENASQIDKLKGVNNDFIKELKNLLITEFNRGVTGQIGVDKIAQDNLKAIEKDPNFKNYTEIIGKGENKQNREKEFPKVFAQENLQNIADDNAKLKNYKEFLPFLQRAENKTNSRDALSTDLNEQKRGFVTSFGGLSTPVLNDPKNKGSVFAARRDVEEKIKALELKIRSASGPFSPEQVGQFQPASTKDVENRQMPGGLNGIQRGDELAGLLLVAEKLRNANTSIDKLPKAIDLLTKAIEDLQKRLKKPEEKANGGFIGRSMGGSIYNNPTKDIAQRDKYPTLLSRGEFVMNEGAARNNRPELEAMNKGHKVNYFAEGTPETAEQMRTRLFKNKYGFDSSLTKEEKEKVSKDNAPKRAELRAKSDKELKDIQEKYNLTDITLPKDFEFEGYEKHLNKIRPDRRIKKEGRSEVRDISDVKYSVRDIRFEFERAVSDLAYVNAEGRKLSKDEDLADNTIGRITFGNDTVKEQLEKIKEGKDVPFSLKEIAANANNFDYEGEFFHHLKDFTPRYPFSYGDAIDPSISNDIKAGLVYGLRDTWKKVGGSYGTNLNPIMGKYEAIHEANVINSRNEKGLPPEPPKEWEVFFNKEGQQVYPEIFPSKTPLIPSTFKLPQMNLDTGEFDGKENTNQQESDILIDLIKQAREQKKQALAQNIENIKKKVNAQIQAESSLTKGIPLKGVDAKLAKTNQNLYARIANPRLSDDKLPFPVQGFRGEFTPEAEAAPVTRPTIAMQEAKAIENVEIQKQTGRKRFDRIEDANNLNLRMQAESGRHGDFSREGLGLYKQENESFVGPPEDPQDKIKKMMAFKKNQIQSGDTDSLAQRLHTQIAKTIASYKEPKMDFNDPLVYSKFLSQPEIFKQIDKDGIIKNVPSTTLQADSRKSLKVYADKKIPALYPAIMALQEYYDSVNERRFGFNNTEDFARTTQNKNIELATKMDREAAMLIARKARGEVRVDELDESSDISPISGWEPKYYARVLANTYRDYHHSLGKKWLGTELSFDTFTDPLSFENAMKFFEPHDYDEKDKNYQDAYDRSRVIIKDLANVDSHRSDLGYARPFFEKVKPKTQELVNFIKSKIDYKKLGIRAFMDLRKDVPQEHTNNEVEAYKDQKEKDDERIKNKSAVNNTEKIKNQSGQVINVPNNPAEAAKVIAEEQAKPVGQAKPPVIPMPVQESKPVVAADQTKPKISPEEMMNKLFNEGPKEGKAVLDFNQNGIRIQGSPEQEKEYATVQTYLNSPTYKAMKILQDKIDNIKLKQSLDIVKDSTAYPENAELSDTIYLRWLNEQVSTLKSQDIISEPYKAYTKLVAGKIGEKFIDFKSSGGPVAYRSFGGGVGGVDAMLTPGEMVISPEKAAENEGVLRHINNGGDVKNFNFGGRVRRGRSFRVPAYAPNPDPERFEKVGSDSVAAPGLAAGSFVVNARDTAKNLPFLQHLASGGSVGYYQKGGGLDKRDFDLLGDPTEKDTKYTGGIDKLTKKVFGSAPSVYENPLKEKFNLANMKDVENKLEKMARAVHREDQGVIKDKNGMPVFSDERMLYNEITNGISSKDFTKFLNSGRMEKSQAEYERLSKIKEDKELQNLPALNAELNSPFKPSKPISEQESLDKETGRLNRESNRTEIEKLRIKLDQLKQDPFNPKVNAEYDRVSALIEKKEKKSRDMIGYPLKEEEDDGGAAAEEERLRNEKIRMTTANRIPIAIRKMQLDRLDIFDPDKIMEIQQLQEEISILEGNPKDLARTAYIDELARRKRLSPEQKNQEALDKETRRQNRESNRTEVENLRTKRDQIKQESIDPKDKNNIEHKRISDLIKEKEEKYRDMIGYPLKKENFNLLPQAPGFADGGAVGYYKIGGRVNRIANNLDAQKRKSEKQNGPNYDVFERHMENKKQKILNFNDMPKLLKGNKEIDKTYLTKMKHFEPNYIEGLDPKIAKNFMNQLNSKNIKGVAGPDADFNNADYFGEIGRAFNERHTFLRNQDVTALHESLDLKTKNRVDLEQGVSGEIIAIDKPLEQARDRKKIDRHGLFTSPTKIRNKGLKAFEFMKAYGEVDKDGKPIHTAITARAEYFGPNQGPEDFFNLRFKSKDRAREEFDIKNLIGKPRRFDQGGYVNGASDGDTIPAYLSAGEFVLPRNTVDKIGPGPLNEMIKPTQRLYNGGAVGSPRASVFDKMNNVANSQSANSMDVDSLNNAAREFNKAAKSFETSMAKMEKSAKTLEGAMDKLSKVNIPENITGTIKVDNKIDLDITSSNFAMDMTTAVGKAVSDITGRLKDATDGKIDIA